MHCTHCRRLPKSQQVLWETLEEIAGNLKPTPQSDHPHRRQSGMRVHPSNHSQKKVSLNQGQWEKGSSRSGTAELDRRPFLGPLEWSYFMISAKIHVQLFNLWWTFQPLNPSPHHVRCCGGQKPQTKILLTPEAVRKVNIFEIVDLVNPRYFCIAEKKNI